MASRQKNLSVENLESRLNLSSASSLLTPEIPSVLQMMRDQQTLMSRPNIISLSSLISTSVTEEGGAKAGNKGIVSAATKIKATAVADGVNVTWTDRASNEDGFRVWRSTDWVNYEMVGEVGANTTSFKDTTAAPGTTYYYKVQTFNTSVAVMTPLTATVKTMAAPLQETLKAPTAPGLPTVVTTESSAALSWTDQSTDEDGFKVYRSEDGTNFSLVVTLGAGETSFSESGLSSSTIYFYKVTSFNAGGETSGLSVSAATQAPALPTAPSAASGVIATSGTGTVTLKWTDTSSNELGYRLYRSTDGTNFSLAAELDADATAYVDTGLNEGTNYWYRVGAWNEGGEMVSGVVTVETQISAPAQPAGLDVTGSSASTVSLSWTDAANNESGYKVYRSLDGTNFSLAANLGAGSTNFTETGLSEGTTYYYKVAAWNSGGETATSAVSVKTSVSAPAAASGLGVAGTTTNSITLKWSDLATNESGYKVYRSTDGVNFALATTLSAGTASYTNTGLNEGTTYYYKVGVWNAGGETLSNAVSATTAVSKPTSASGLAVVSSTTSAIALKWTDASNNETGFQVYRSTDGVNFTVAASLGAGASSFTDTGLKEGTTYTYKIGAWNSGGETLSGAVTGTTTVAAPSAATGLAVSSVTTSAISIKWTDASSNETGFKVYRSTDGTNYTLAITLGAGSTSYTDSGIAEGTKVFYKVGAYNAGGEAATAAVSATTAVSRPAAATGVAVKSTTTNSVAISWMDASTNESGFRVYRSTDGTNYTLATSLGAGSTSYTLSGLAEGTKVYLKVASWNAGGETMSAAVSSTTAVSAPAAPTGLAVTATTTSSVAIKWTDASSNETSFKVYRSTDGTNFTLINTLSAGATSYTDSALTQNTKYWYQVSAVNAGGETKAAAVATATNLSAPGAPSNTTVNALSTSSIGLTWTDISGIESGYKVYRSTDGATYSLVATIAANSTGYTDTGLAASTKYFYKVGAYNAAGETFSAAVSTSTLAPVVVPTGPDATSGVTFATASMTSFTELVVSGTSGNDSIYVTQSGGKLNIVHNGVTTTYDATFGDIKIYGAAGSDTITVDSSVTIASLIYGGDGNNTIKALGTGKMSIISIGNGTNTVTGNGINTSYWANAADIVNASSAEVALKAVNRVGEFYQPFSTDKTSADYVSRTLAGQNLKDPTDSGAVVRLTKNSFFGTGPTKDDVNQKGIADCYFLADLSALAYASPGQLQNMAVDLGDGTYAFRFVRSGVTSYVRVDGDLSAGGQAFGMKWTAPGKNGNQWAPLFEKAYAFYRSAANTYASLGWGSPTTVFRDLGLTASSVSASGLTDSTLESTVNKALSSSKPIVALSKSTASGAIVASHVYTILGVYRDASGALMIKMRNPWGYDGGSVNDGNTGDAVVTVSFTTFQANFSSVSYQT